MCRRAAKAAARPDGDAHAVRGSCLSASATAQDRDLGRHRAVELAAR